MSKLDILIAPHPTLKQRTAAVRAVDAGIRRLLDDMLETMYAAPGIGLAAPQVGILQRVVVLDVSAKDEEKAPFCLVNPEIVTRSDEAVIGEEGCLSLPDMYAEVERWSQVRVRYLDRDGEQREVDAEGLLARCLQHEIDHLEGILFVDHLSPLKRRMIMRKLIKRQRDNGPG